MADGPEKVPDPVYTTATPIPAGTTPSPHQTANTMYSDPSGYPPQSTPYGQPQQPYGQAPAYGQPPPQQYGQQSMYGPPPGAPSYSPAQQYGSPQQPPPPQTYGAPPPAQNGGMPYGNGNGVAPQAMGAPPPVAMGKPAKRKVCGMPCKIFVIVMVVVILVVLGAIGAAVGVVLSNRNSNGGSGSNGDFRCPADDGDTYTPEDDQYGDFQIVCSTFYEASLITTVDADTFKDCLEICNEDRTCLGVAYFFDVDEINCQLWDSFDVTERLEAQQDTGYALYTSQLSGT